VKTVHIDVVATGSIPATLHHASDGSVAHASRLLTEGTDVSREERTQVRRIGRIGPRRDFDDGGDPGESVRLAGEGQDALLGDHLVGVQRNTRKQTRHRVRTTQDLEDLGAPERDGERSRDRMGHDTGLGATESRNGRLLPVHVGRGIRGQRVRGSGEARLGSPRDGGRE